MAVYGREPKMPVVCPQLLRNLGRTPISYPVLTGEFTVCPSRAGFSRKSKIVKSAFTIQPSTSDT